MNDQRAIAEAYQPLFDLMINEYDKLLTVEEMDEIRIAVHKVNENLKKLEQ